MTDEQWVWTEKNSADYRRIAPLSVVTLRPPSSTAILPPKFGPN